MNYSISQQKFNDTALPMLPIIIAQQAVLLPLYFFIPVWICVFNLAITCLLLWSKKYKQLVLPRWIKVVITLVAIAGILLSFQQYYGKEAGVALISVMYGLKVLEVKKSRDANLLLNLGFFMLVAGFLFSQKPLIAFYQIIPIIAILNALVALNSLSKLKIIQAKKKQILVLKNVLKKLFIYLFLALPIMVILFLFFPRLNTSLWKMPSSSQSSTGVSDSMSPGDISSLKLSTEIAFRTQFKGESPQPSQLYWRTIVLDKYDGIYWTRSNSNKNNPAEIPDDANNNGVFDYTIAMEATRQKYLVTLDRPIDIPQSAKLESDYVLKSNTWNHDRTRYQLRSSTNFPLDNNLSKEKLIDNISLPKVGNSKSRQWAVNHRQLFEDDWDYIVSILTQINQQEYFYTLTPPIMDEDMVDSFWFDHKKGFCEHYAGALVFLARAANIPARVVIGYQGGDKNPLSNYWIVRNLNAHAWTEIWIEGKGWLRVDPTSAIAPFRVEETLLSDYRQRNSLFDNFDFVELEDISLLKRLSYWQDQFNNGWNDWILDYNDQKQRSLFDNFGFPSINTQQMIIIMIILVGIFVFITSLQLFQRKPSISALALAYLNLLKQLDKKSIVQYQLSLGPADLKAKLNSINTTQYQNLILLLEQYINFRYQHEDTDPQVEKTLIKSFKKIKLEK